MIKSKKELIKIITYTVCLVFAFIYIKPIFNILKAIVKILTPLLMGIFIAFILNVIMQKIENNWFKNTKLQDKTKRILSLCLAIFFVLTLIALLFLLIIPEMKTTIELLIDNLPLYQENINALLNKLDISKNAFSELSVAINNYIIDNKQNILNITIGFAGDIFRNLASFFLGIVFAVYILSKKEQLTLQGKKLLNAYLPQKKINKIIEVLRLTNNTFSNFITGQCMDALLLGALCFLGMFILRLPYALAISVLISFTALIPIFGPLIGTLIGAFLIFMISPLKALIFIIFIIVLQQIEGDFIYPRIVGKKVNLPSIWVLLAVTIGGSINGILGMFMSVPIAAIIYSIIVNNVNERLAKKKIKID